MAGLLEGMTPQQYGLLAAGLGMMGNSRGRSLGESISAGGVQGINAMNQMQQGQFEAQQQQQLQAMRELQMQQMQEQMQGERDSRANITRFGDSLRGSGYQESDPIGKAMLDAGMVGDYLKMKKTNTADPYYTPQVTRDGRLARFNNRTGQLEYVDAGGQPVYAAGQDPTTQGNITRSRESNQFKTIETPTGAHQSGFVDNLIPMSKADEQATIQRLNSQPGALTPGEYDALTGGAKSSPTVTGLTPGEKKAQEETAKNTVEAKANYSQASENATYLNDLLNKVKNHPGLPGVVGFPNLKEYIPGTQEKDFRVLLDQVGGKQFLEAFSALKGGGQITEMEGKKATDAIARMQTAQSEKAFREAVDEFQAAISRGVRIKAEKAGIQQSSDQDLLNKYLGK